MRPYFGFVRSLCFNLFMYVHRLNTFKHLFKEGSMYVSRFDVTRSNLNFMLSDSPLSIRLNDSTTFKEKTVPNSPHFQGKDLVMVTIKINRYLLLSYRSFYTLIIVAHFWVFSTLFDFESDLPVTLIVFDSQTLSFQKQVHGLRGDPMVVATSINPKLIGRYSFDYIFFFLVKFVPPKSSLKLTTTTNLQAVCSWMPQQEHDYISTRRLMQARVTIISESFIIPITLHL